MPGIQSDVQENEISSRDWAEIPWFRKPIFIIISFLIFMPAAVLIMWTGDIFYRKDGIVYTRSRKQKIMMTLAMVLLMSSFYLRNTK